MSLHACICMTHVQTITNTVHALKMQLHVHVNVHIHEHVHVHVHVQQKATSFARRTHRSLLHQVGMRMRLTSKHGRRRRFHWSTARHLRAGSAHARRVAAVTAHATGHASTPAAAARSPARTAAGTGHAHARVVAMTVAVLVTVKCRLVGSHLRTHEHIGRLNGMSRLIQ